MKPNIGNRSTTNNLVFIAIILGLTIIKNTVYINNSSQRSSIGAVGVRLWSSARPRKLLELRNLNLLDFVEVSAQPLTAAWLCFTLKYGCQAPIAANAHVVRSHILEIKHSFRYKK